MQSKIKIAKTIYSTAIIFACMLLAFGANAATEPSMYVSPSTGIHVVESEFSVSVILDTDGKKINAAEAVMIYDPQKLQITRTSIDDSIFSSWIVEPTFDNETGRLEFAGNTPGEYQGVEGKVLTISFRAIEEGTTNLRFRSGAMLAADGKGTNILSKLISGVYTITNSITEVIPQADYVAPYNAPRAPTVTSLTHPDQDKWYVRNNAELRWSVPENVSAVRMLTDQSPYSIPTVTFYEPVNEKIIQNIEDGVWYFHLQLRNAYGWGDISHFRIKIDSTKPAHFRINELDNKDDSSPTVRFIVDAFDATSSIEKYEVNIDSDIIIWSEKGNQIHEVGPLPPGAHTAIVKAIDGAGNYLVDTINFEIKPLNPPVFYEYPDVLNSGSALVIKGRSYPNTEALVWFKEEGEEAEEHIVATDENGSFTFIPPSIPRDGVYSIWAVARDSRGALSEQSKKIVVSVRPPGVLMAAAYALDTVSIFVPLLSVLFLIVVLAIYFYHRTFALKEALNKEVKEAEMVVHKSFLTLKKEANMHVRLLERAKVRRNLTREEVAVMSGLKGHLSKIENSIEKEIHDISKTLDARPTNKKNKEGFFQALKNLKDSKILKKPAK